jgi:hypothetical protein
MRKSSKAASAKTQREHTQEQHSPMVAHCIGNCCVPILVRIRTHPHPPRGGVMREGRARGAGERSPPPPDCCCSNPNMLVLLDYISNMRPFIAWCIEKRHILTRSDVFDGLFAGCVDVVLYVLCTCLTIVYENRMRVWLKRGGVQFGGTAVCAADLSVLTTGRV